MTQKIIQHYMKENKDIRCELLLAKFNIKNNWLSLIELRYNHSKYQESIMRLRKGEFDNIKYDIISESKAGIRGFRFRGVDK